MKRIVSSQLGYCHTYAKSCMKSTFLLHLKPISSSFRHLLHVNSLGEEHTVGQSRTTAAVGNCTPPQLRLDYSNWHFFQQTDSTAVHCSLTFVIKIKEDLHKKF